MKQNNKIIIFMIFATIIFIIDQSIKISIIEYANEQNPIFQSKFIDVVLVFNKGIAFSIGSFIGAWLKWIILILILIVSWIAIKTKDIFDVYYIPIGIIIGAGCSNLIDRFIRNGVVDYVYWHYGFQFAIFNFADATINLSVAYMFLRYSLNKNK